MQAAVGSRQVLVNATASGRIYPAVPSRCQQRALDGKVDRIETVTTFMAATCELSAVRRLFAAVRGQECLQVVEKLGMPDCGEMIRPWDDHQCQIRHHALQPVDLRLDRVKLADQS